MPNTSWLGKTDFVGHFLMLTVFVFQNSVLWYHFIVTAFHYMLLSIDEIYSKTMKN